MFLYALLLHQLSADMLKNLAVWSPYTWIWPNSSTAVFNFSLALSLFNRAKHPSLKVYTIQTAASVRCLSVRMLDFSLDRQQQKNRWTRKTLLENSALKRDRLSQQKLCDDIMIRCLKPIFNYVFWKTILQKNVK